MNAPARRRRRRRLGRSSSESNASGLSNSKEVDSSDSSSEGSFNGSNSRDDEGEEEEKDVDDDEGEKMEYLAPDYPQEDSRMTQTRFLDLDRSLNRKGKRFKVFEIEPGSNHDDIIINLIII